MSSRIFRLWVITVLIVGVCVAGASFSFAQEYRATIIGQVTDPSGAHIPRATVTAVQHSTQQAYTTKSNGDGIFSLDFIMPGQFTVTIEAQGFSKRVYPNVTLQAGQKLNLNVTLVVGSVRQAVTVTASPGLLNTANASSGGVVDQTIVESTPSSGHDTWQDVIFTQGVQMVGNTQFSSNPGFGSSPGVIINGSTTSGQSWSLNGAPVSPGASANFVPSQDDVQELQANINGGADAGRGAEGGGFTAVVKHGTNSFHGELYDYYSNKVLYAAQYSENLTGEPKGTLYLNQFGGNLGGPIQKGKTFFFFGYEGYRLDQPISGVDSVPTAAMRAGDFTGSGYTVYDPTTVACITETKVGCSTYGRTEFPNDTIPQSDISPAGASIMSLYPQPNLSGEASNYATLPPRHLGYNQYIGRVDHDFSDSTRLYDLFTQTGTNSFSSGGVDVGVGNQNSLATTLDDNAVLDLTRTFSPSLVGDFKTSFSRYTSFTTTGTAVAQNYSIPGLSMPVVPTTTHQNIAPEVSVTNYTGLIGNTANGSVSNNWYLSPSLEEVKGRHTLHYGFEFQDFQSGADGIPSDPNGSFSFTGQWSQENPLTAATGSGNSLADLLLGYPASGSVGWAINDFVSNHYYAAYLQDDFKALKNVTLNLGLRWEATTSPSERHNGINGPFCFTCTNPYSAQIDYASYPTLQNPLTGGYTFAGVTAPHAPDNVALNNWQPRFGIAWAITPKTVFRGGFGIYDGFLNPGTQDVGFSETTSYVESLNGNVNPSGYFLSGKPYPSGVIAPAGASLGYETDAGDAITYYGTTGATPWTQHWSAGIQRALPKRILLDVEYQGSHFHFYSVSQPWGVISSAEQAACFANNAVCNDSVSNPFYGVLPTTATLGASKTLDAWELMRQEPLFNGVTQSNDPLGYGVYNALEVRVQRQIKGLDFVANYDYANWMDAGAYLNDTDFRDANLWYGPNGGGPRNYLDANVVWDVPVGQGGLLFRNAHGLLSGLLSHWQWDTVLLYYTGAPLAPPSANLVGGPGCTSYLAAGGQTAAHWFNNDESCYKTLNQWQARTAPLYLGYLHDPDWFTWNAGLQKRFALPREGMFIQFRIEGDDITNTPIFGGPNTTLSDVPTFETNIGETGFGTLPTSSATTRDFFASFKLIF